MNHNVILLTQFSQFTYWPILTGTVTTNSGMHS